MESNKQLSFAIKQLLEFFRFIRNIMIDRYALFADWKLTYHMYPDWTINQIYLYKVESGTVLDSHYFYSFSHSLGIL